MALNTSTTTIGFQANSRSLWGPGQGTSFSFDFDNLVFRPTIGPFGDRVAASLPFGVDLGIDYALSMSGIEYGFSVIT